MYKFLGVIALCLVACATSPKSAGERQNLTQSAQATLQEMIRRDPSLPDLLSRAEGYVVFPSIGKGGFVVGGAHGRGVLFERGAPAGFASMSQASVGAQLGAQTYSQIVVFITREALDRFKAGTYSLGGEINAVVLTAGAAGATDFRHDVAVFVEVKGGVMAGITVTGQKLSFDRG
jgi:lipid-binding SYLF domain-containing protein